MNTVFFVLYLVLVSNSSAVWPIDNFYKSNNILPIPVGIAPSLAGSMTKGAKMALEYCQSVFRWDRWNCTTSSFFRLSKQPPSRETAFSRAILAAGIVHSVTKDCSKGVIADCGCDSTLGPPSVTSSNSWKLNNLLTPYNSTGDGGNHSTDWSWGGCSDDPKYALDATRRLLVNLEKGNDAASYIRRHNGNLGREIIRDTMVKKCRCHGVSGSCSVQTCWIQVAPFAEVSRQLREKYRKAKRLTYETVEMSLSLGNSARELAEEKLIPVKKNSLVYLVQSPDYCVSNSAEDIPGTKGRMCSRTTSELASREERRSCKTLCKDCGYRVRKVERQETKRCNCKFIWCCEVKCEMCVVDVNEYFCY